MSFYAMLMVALFAVFGVCGPGLEKHNLCVGLEKRKGFGSRSRSYRQGKTLFSLPPSSVTSLESTSSISYKPRMERSARGDISKLGLIDCEAPWASLRGYTANEKTWFKGWNMASCYFSNSTHSLQHRWHRYSTLCLHLYLYKWSSYTKIC